MGPSLSADHHHPHQSQHLPQLPSLDRFSASNRMEMNGEDGGEERGEAGRRATTTTTRPGSARRRTQGQWSPYSSHSSRPSTSTSASPVQLARLIPLLFLLFQTAFCNSVPQRRSSSSSSSASSGASDLLTLRDECYHRYANTDHHSSLLHWLHRKNASHYSPISPSYQQALLKLQAQELAHGLQVTTGASSCSTRKMKVISASTPLRERALCQFEYILNYKPNRIPSTFTEVKCSCPRPSVRMVGNRMFECEPLRYQVRVLLFDPECSAYTEHTETIALACVPVMQANTNAEGDGEDDIAIPVPAEQPDFVPT